MENKYELIANLTNETKQVYEKYYESEKYQIIANEEGMILAKKINNNVNLEHEKIIIDLIKSMIKQYKAEGILHIDLTQEFESIMNEIKNEKSIECTDNRISWPIRQAIKRAVLLKK